MRKETLKSQAKTCPRSHTSGEQHFYTFPPLAHSARLPIHDTTKMAATESTAIPTKLNMKGISPPYSLCSISLQPSTLLSTHSLLRPSPALASPQTLSWSPPTPLLLLLSFLCRCSFLSITHSAGAPQGPILGPLL